MPIKTKFSEQSRVQIPALLHILKLGYTYIDRNERKELGLDDYNILKDVLKDKFLEFNPGQSENDFETFYREKITNSLHNEDLGKAFYQTLIGKNERNLIDFENINNNVFHATAELGYNSDSSSNAGNRGFRSDITIFVNGLPLVFIEVKKPNNLKGIYDEFNRLVNIRFKNPDHRKYFNLTQFMIFSNNGEYNTSGDPSKRLNNGTFYCTFSHGKPFFNMFKEDNPLQEKYAPYHKNFPYQALGKDLVSKVAEGKEIRLDSSDIYMPVNRALTSLCSKERLLFLIRYGIAYVKADAVTENGQTTSYHQKHIMRYQQFFAAQAVKEKLFGEQAQLDDDFAKLVNSSFADASEDTSEANSEDNSEASPSAESIRNLKRNLYKKDKKGVIWHTQGSGKTALSYYLLNLLDDLYSKKGITTRFYFVVDRLDLLKQASNEFSIRGLDVYVPENVEDLNNDFANLTKSNLNGGKSITVVNIQKFSKENDKELVNPNDLKLQRIFIVDEAHRSYKQENADKLSSQGEFLQRLLNADKNAVRLALTGTPIIKKDAKTTDIFGKYIHTYLYNQSVEDGYTVKLQRVEVDTTFKYDSEQVARSFIESGQNPFVTQEEYEDFTKDVESSTVDLLAGFSEYESDDVDILDIEDDFDEFEVESSESANSSPLESSVAPTPKIKSIFSLPKSVSLIPRISKGEGSKNNRFASTSGSNREESKTKENKLTDNKKEPSLTEDYTGSNSGNQNQENQENFLSKEKIDEILDIFKNNDSFKLPPKFRNLEKKVLESDKYIECLSKYIVRSFFAFRNDHNEANFSNPPLGDELGAMVICYTSKQALRLQKRFDADVKAYLKENNLEADKELTSALILCNENDKDYRADEINKFKRGEIDILFVHSMLLTGFDCPRLKKLYICRRLRDHTLLQAITRVNRPYKDMVYGYIEDIAGITYDFEQINKAYNDEFKKIFDSDEDFFDIVSIFNENKEKVIDNLRKFTDIFDEDIDEFSTKVTALCNDEDVEKLREIRAVFKTCLANKTTLLNIDIDTVSDDLKRILRRLREIDATTVKNYIREVEAALMNLKLKHNTGGEESKDDFLDCIEIIMTKVDTSILEINEKAKQSKRLKSIKEKIIKLFENGSPDVHEILKRFNELTNSQVLDEYNEFDKELAEKSSIREKLVKKFDGNIALANVYTNVENIIVTRSTDLSLSTTEESQEACNFSDVFELEDEIKLFAQILSKLEANQASISNDNILQAIKNQAENLTQSEHFEYIFNQYQQEKENLFGRNSTFFN